jgi:glycerol-3-phosphate O-acyltransferase / dihydroxyacetone phosphate acyltransferase
MIYPLLRAVAGIALRWYYSGIDVEGADQVPTRAPLLLAVNHPNALVDALIVAWVIPRRLVLTAKSTIFVNPVASALLRHVGVVPLRRAADETNRAGTLDPGRNEGAFRAVHDALARGRVALIFPEGISHDEPYLAPLRTGAARIALGARDDAGIHGLAIVPVGLTFERKELPRSRVLVQVGEPIDVEAWRASRPDADADALTREIDTRLRAVTLNYESSGDAARARALASSMARLLEPPPSVAAGAPLSTEIAVARRIQAARVRLENADAITQQRVDALLRRLAAFDRRVAEEDLDVADVGISVSVADGARFVAREGWRLLAGAPVAAWGTLNHWLPFTVARAIAMRGVQSAADPAMRTIVAGAVLVLLGYLVQGVIIGALASPLIALAYLVSLPLAADVNFALRERLERARRRARAFRRFRADRRLQAALCAELAWLRQEAQALDARLRDQDAASDVAAHSG